MEARTRARRHLDAQSWREVFRRFEGSGESVVGFCKREGLNTSSFHRWRQRLATTTAASTSQGGREPVRQSAAANFIEMGSMSSQTERASRLEIRLELGGGVVLHLVRG
jgi:putative transposase